jgi:hypothetical protein
MGKATKVTGINKIRKWIEDYACEAVLNDLTSKHGIAFTDSIQSRTEAAARDEFIPLAENAAHQRGIAQVILKKIRSGSLWNRVIKRLRSDGYFVYRVSDRWLEAEEHWGDEEYLWETRSRYIPSAQHPTVALVASDFEKWVTSASVESHSASANGSLEGLISKYDNATFKGVLTDEMALGAARTVDKGEITQASYAGNRVFEEELHRLRGLRVINGN